MDTVLFVVSAVVFGGLAVAGSLRRIHRARRPIRYDRDGRPNLGHPTGCACERQPNVHSCALAELYAAEIRRRS